MSDPTRQIGSYTLIRVLGEGGMGIVHLAQDGDFKLVAVKELRPELAARPDFLRRFTREAAAARKVARFCTAPVLDAGIDGKTAYIVTDYVEGPDLRSVVKEQGPLSGANLEALAVGVATALTAIHEAGVVHRDLKPANILLSPVGPRVIDFGIAQLAEPEVTRSATVMGTPEYMSPEQAKGEPVTAASDVFAWGGVVAYAATGRPPFGTGHMPEVLYRVAHHVPDLKGVDERLRPLVEQALDKDPSRRPTAQQLLDRLLGRESITAASATRLVTGTWTPSPTLPPKSPISPPRRPIRSRWMKPAAAIAVAAMALGASVLVWRPWEVAAQQGSGTRGTQQDGVLAERDTITSDEKNQSIPVHITIDSLVRQGDEVTLFWTLRNDSPSGAEVRLESVLDGGFQSDTKKISLSYAGATEPVHPAMRQDKCVCTHWGYGDTIPAGRSRRFHAIFDRLPGKVEKVDVDLVLLGRVKDIPVTES